MNDYNYNYSPPKPQLQDELAYVQKNIDYYNGRWGSAMGSRYKGWNFVCMFFPYEWMCYRKMYLEAFLSFAAVFALNFALFFMPSEVFVWAIRLAFGAVGNMLYWRKSQRMIKRTDAMDDQDRLEFLQAKGGTSIPGLVICVALEMGYLFVIYFLL